ncbi:MAG: hypothetical protein KDJ80_15155 [Nitratireductor sp.]|nr:hypothetical protein [Nitratireductor sp.]
MRIFDTDFPNGVLAGYFPQSSRVIDFRKTAEHVMLFDTIIGEPQYDYLIDLDASLLDRFFRLYRDIAFDAGAAEQGMRITVYFLLDRTLSSVEAAAETRQLAGKVAFVPVRNEAIGNILAVPQGAKRYHAIEKSREILLPRLSVDALNLIEGPDFSFGAFIARNGEGYPLELKVELFQFLETIYNQRRSDESGMPVAL